MAFRHFSRKNPSPFDQRLEAIHERGFAGLKIQEPHFDPIPKAARGGEIHLDPHHWPGRVACENRNTAFAKKPMLRLLDHGEQPREVGDSSGVGVGEFHAASVDIIGGACHRGDVDLV